MKIFKFCRWYVDIKSLRTADINDYYVIQLLKKYIILVQNKYIFSRPIVYNSLKHIKSNSVNLCALFKILELRADTQSF